MCTPMLCACRKETGFYCMAHKAPVCGDCLCTPEHSACQVTSCPESAQDGAVTDSSVCCSCSHKFSDPNDRVMALSCNHVLHASCYLQILESSAAAKGCYTCPLCNPKIWPLDQNIARFGSILGKRLQDDPLNTKSRIRISANADSSMISTEAFSNLSSCYVGLQNGNHVVDHAASSENGEAGAASSVSIDIGEDHFRSIEKTVAIPKLSKLLSRKVSRGDKKSQQEEPKDEETATSKLLDNTTAIENVHNVVQDSSEGRWRRYRRSAATITPRKILFFFATLSSLGTIILIYFTLAAAGSADT